MHVHLNPFQVVSRAGRAPTDADRGWKDAVDIDPAEVVEVAIRFTDHCGPYVVHCYDLEHPDSG